MINLAEIVSLCDVSFGALSVDATRVVTPLDRQRVACHDIESGEVTGIYNSRSTGTISVVSVSVQGDYLAAGTLFSSLVRAADLPGPTLADHTAEKNCSARDDLRIASKPFDCRIISA